MAKPAQKDLPDHLLPDDDDLAAVASGRDPKPFRVTRDHPVHGALTFTMKLPRVAALADHTVAIDNLLGELAAPARGGTMVLIAAIAGIEELMDPVVVDETVDESEESDVEVKMVRTFYEPRNDFDENFPVLIWTLASQWRQAFTTEKVVTDLGKGSGETPGGDSSSPSDAPTGSPSTTPA